MSMVVPNCHFCGKQITTMSSAYNRVIGWERKREAGGTNALALREPQPEWAHSWCIDMQKAQIPGQEPMF